MVELNVRLRLIVRSADLKLTGNSGDQMKSGGIRVQANAARGLSFSVYQQQHASLTS